jgi:hypothetical protein
MNSHDLIQAVKDRPRPAPPDQSIPQKAWQGVMHKLRESMHIEDLGIHFFSSDQMRRKPVCGDLIRLILPALSEVAPQAAITISLQVTVTATGECLHASPLRFYYTHPSGRLVPRSSLEDAVASALEEACPASAT